VSISFSGAFNPATLTVPGLYVNVQPPQVSAIPPATFGRIGIVGVASWGPVDQATLLGTSQPTGLFGPLTNREYDLVTASMIVLNAQTAAGLGPNQVLVRVTDGTDVAASARLGNATFTSETATVGGSVTNGDSVGLRFTSTSITGSPVTVAYAVGSSDTLTTIATGLTALINASAALKAANITATSAGAVVTIVYPQSITVTFLAVLPGSPTETLTLASGTATVYGGTFSSTHTGSYGNNTTVTIGVGSAASTYKVTVVLPNVGSEVFNNIGGSGATFWQNLASAINNGVSNIRGPSQLVTFAAGVSTATPTAATTTLSGGTDGASGMTSSGFIGTDTAPRTGIYALRNSMCSHAFIPDFSTASLEGALATFGSSEGICMHTAGPPGETPTVAVAARTQDTPWLRRWLGDWCYFADTTNGVSRLLGPQVFGVGAMAGLQPQQSSLNENTPLVVATQRSLTGNPYGQDELALLTQGDIDVICNPIPAGPYFGVRIGLVQSSNDSVNTDNWPGLTSFIARNLAGPGALGTLIGQTITPSFFGTGTGLLSSFFAGLKGTNPPTIQGYSVLFGTQNNPSNQTALGVVVAQVWVQYLGIARIFVVNMQTGTTVVLPGNASGPPNSIIQPNA
jgi:hypothetical protein